MEGWARFEQRARQRRIERRLEAAQTAIRSGRLADAKAALDELQELDPSNPHIQTLSLRLAQPVKTARSRPGAIAVAALSFGAVLLAASWFGKPLPPNPVVETAALVPPPESPLAARVIRFDSPVATSGALESFLRRDDAVRDPETFVAAEPPALLETAPTAVAAVEPRIDLPPPAPFAEPVVLPAPAPVPEPPPVQVAAAPAPAAAAPVDSAPGAVVVDDAAQVREVLQRYRAAYERLDARSVHAVWPGVNQTALARAFDGLESQSLTFRSCDVQLRGATAAVVCTGSARYVAKIGSHEPRVEPLAWNFTLRKNASEWQIESARAER